MESGTENIRVPHRLPLFKHSLSTIDYAKVPSKLFTLCTKLTSKSPLKVTLTSLEILI